LPAITKWAALNRIKTLGMMNNIVLSVVLFKTKFSSNQIIPAKKDRMMPAVK
jgi:hypothetical protein